MSAGICRPQSTTETGLTQFQWCRAYLITLLQSRVVMSFRQFGALGVPQKIRVVVVHLGVVGQRYQAGPVHAKCVGKLQKNVLQDLRLTSQVTSISVQG